MSYLAKLIIQADIQDALDAAIEAAMTDTQRAIKDAIAAALEIDWRWWS